MSGYWNVNSNLISNSATLSSLSITNMTVSNIYYTGSIIQNGTSASVLSSSNNFIVTNLTSTNLISTNLTSTNLTSTNLISTNLTSTNLISTNFSTSSLQASNSTIPNLVSTNFSTSSLQASTARYQGGTQAIQLSPPITGGENSIGFYYGSSFTSTSWAMGINLGAGGISNGFSIYNSSLGSQVLTITTAGNLKLPAGSLNVPFNSNTLGNIFTTGGNVGINNVNPTFSLDIAGTTRTINTTVASSGTLNVAGPGTSLLLPQTTTLGSLASFYGPSGVGIYSNFDLSTFAPQAGSSYLPGVRFSMFDLGNANTSFNILTKVPSGASMGSRIFIDGSGNVGINTTVPAYTLDINGTIQASGTNNTNWTPTSIFTNNSNIGSNGIASFLSPNIPTGTSSVTYFGRSLSLGNSGQLLYNYAGSNNTGNSISISNYGLNGSIYLLNNANVGINTSNPSQIMHIQKSGSDNYIKVDAGGITNNYSGIMLTEHNINYGWTIRNNAVTDLLHISYQDNTLIFTDLITFDRVNNRMGINTSSPSYTLDINGTGRFTGSLSLNNRISSLGYQYNVSSTNGNPITTNMNVINKRIKSSRANAVSAVSTWTSRSFTTTGFWAAITWSPELGLFVAGSNGVSSSCQTSPDGINWTARTLGTSIQAWDVIWSPELSLFVMTNNSTSSTTNPFQTSSDGITWTTITTASAYKITGICWSADLGIFVACAGTAGALVSSNGTSWTANAITGSASGNQRVSWSSELNIFVMTNNANGFFYSSNGTSWTSVSFTSIGTILPICWSGELNLFVAGGSIASTSTFATSSDGITWTLRTCPVTSMTHTNIVWSPELSLFLTSSGSYTFSSHDGINWTTRSSTLNSVYSCCWSPDLSIFLLTSNNGVNNVYTSNTGIPTGSNTLLAPKSQLAINSAGNVGINNASPSTTLDVIGTIRSTSFNTISSGVGLEFSYNATVSTGNIYSYNRSNTTYNTLNFNDKSIITSNGNFGIGTTTPNSPLHISTNGTQGIYAGPFTFTSGGTGTLLNMLYKTQAVFNSNTNGWPANTGTIGNAICLRLRGNDDGVMDFGVNSGNGGWIQSTNFNGNTVNTYSTNYPLILNPNGGNIGINNTNPAYTLDIKGNSRISTKLDIGGTQPIFNSNTIGQLFLTGASGNINGGHLLMNTTQDSFPTFHLLNWQHDGIYMGFDTYYDGTNWRNSTTATGFGIIKNNAQLSFNYQYSTGQGGLGTSQLSGTSAMVIGSTGNVGINNVSPSSQLDVISTNTFGNIFLGTNVQNRKIVLYSSSVNDHQYYGFGINTGTLRYQVDITTADHVFFAATSSTASNELLRIKGNGNVGISTSSPSGILQISSAALFTSSGNLTCTGDIISFGSVSDQRLKTNITSLSSELAIDTVKKLNPVTFNWRNDIFNIEKQNKYDSGFIAQEIEAILPHATGEYTHIESGTVYKNIKHERIVPYLTTVIQNLLERIEILEKNQSL